MRPTRLPLLVAVAVLASLAPARAAAQEGEAWAALRRTPMASLHALTPAALGVVADSTRRFGVMGVSGASQLVLATTGWIGRTQVALAMSDRDPQYRWRPRAVGLAVGRQLARWVAWSDAASVSVGAVVGVGQQPDRSERQYVRTIDGEPWDTTLSLRTGMHRSVTAMLPVAVTWHPVGRPDDARALSLRAYVAPAATSGRRSDYERPYREAPQLVVPAPTPGRTAGDLFMVVGGRVEGLWGLSVDVARRQAPETSMGYSGWSAGVAYTLPLPF